MKIEFRKNMKNNLALKQNIKFLCLGIVLTLNMSNAEAQTDLNGITYKFAEFYKSNQADSIFNMFSREMKNALSVEGTRQFIFQLKQQLGNITKSRTVPTIDSTFRDYRLSFEKPLVEISLIVKGGLIEGIRQKEAETDHSGAMHNESPDNYLISNSVGTLKATITLPEQKGRVPVVLFIAGSGPTDRNMNQGNSLKTNAFLMLAKGLAKNGIASVRYDKRGVGKSTISKNSSDIRMQDLISDADLFIQELKKDNRFSQVIVLGHSEGALIGLLASISTNPTAFISLCGYSNDIGSLLRKQLKEVVSANELLIATEVLDSLSVGKLVNRQFSPTLASIFNKSAQTYIMSSMKYNASHEIKKIQIPALIVGGTTDLQIGIDEAYALANARPEAKLRLISGMNHVLKQTPADRNLNLQSYNNPETILHPDLLPILVDFITKTASK